MADLTAVQNKKSPSPGFVFIPGTNIQLPESLSGFISKEAPAPLSDYVDSARDSDLDESEDVIVISADAIDDRITHSAQPTPNLNTPSLLHPPSGTGERAEKVICECALDLHEHLADTLDVITVTLSGVPDGAIPSVGTDLGRGNWIVMAGEIKKLGNLIITSPCVPGDVISLKIIASYATPAGDFMEEVSTIDAVFEVEGPPLLKPAPALKLRVNLGKGSLRRK